MRRALLSLFESRRFEEFHPPVLALRAEETSFYGTRASLKAVRAHVRVVLYLAVNCVCVLCLLRFFRMHPRSDVTRDG